MKPRVLGSSGIPVSEIGYGCMGLTWAYGTGVTPETEQSAIDLLHTAIDLGVTLFDTADMYGPYTNEEFVGKALAPRRGEVVIATKCGLVVQGDRTNYNMRRDGTPAHIREACEDSLKRLRTDVIDLYQLHRVDPNVPVEESVGAMADLVREGKVRAIGLSEVDVPTLERAMKVYPIASLQSEFSLFERNVQAEILPWCKAHNVALLPYSPLGRGMLTGRLTRDEIRAGDFRATLPRFQAEAFDHNRRIVQRVEAVAKRAGTTPGQVALAWLLAQGENVVPIPGTKRLEYLKENVAAADIFLTENDLHELDALPAPMGNRYAEAKSP